MTRIPWGSELYYAAYKAAKHAQHSLYEEVLLCRRTMPADIEAIMEDMLRSRPEHSVRMADDSAQRCFREILKSRQLDMLLESKTVLHIIAAEKEEWVRIGLWPLFMRLGNLDIMVLSDGGAVA